MGKEPNIYKRLPGRGTEVIYYVRLYQGPDHLLQVLSTGFNETYKRFAYRDIQAITLRKTNMGKVWNGIWGVLIVLFAVPASFVNGPAAVGLGIVSAIFLILLGANLAMGPTVVAYLRTAVQVEKLPSLRRLRSARSTLSILNPLIASAQGQFQAEGLPASTAGNPPAPDPNPAQTAPGPSAAQEAPPIISDNEG